MALKKGNHALLNDLDYVCPEWFDEYNTSNIEGIKAAITFANANKKKVVLTQDYTTNNAIELSNVNVVLIAKNNSKITNTNTTNHVLKFANSTIEIIGLSIVGSKTTRDNRNAGIRLDDCPYVRIKNCTIENVAGAGVYTQNTSNAIIENNVVRNTGADGIHTTAKSKNVIVQNNILENTGDDSISFVSYRSQIEQVSDCVARGNRIKDAGARGLSNIGSKNIQFIQNDVRGSVAAGVIVSQESSYQTFGTENTIIRGNTFDNCVTSSTITHGTITLSRSEIGYENKNVTIESNELRNNNRECVRFATGDTTTTAHRNIIIKNNIFSSSTMCIMPINTTNLTIDNNIFSEIKQECFYDNGKTDGVVSITNNQCTNINTDGNTSKKVFTLRTSNAFYIIRGNVVINPVGIVRAFDINGTNTTYYCNDNVLVGCDIVGGADKTLIAPTSVFDTYMKSRVVYMAVGRTDATDWQRIN